MHAVIQNTNIILILASGNRTRYSFHRCNRSLSMFANRRAGRDDTMELKGEATPLKVRNVLIYIQITS